MSLNLFVLKEALEIAYMGSGMPLLYLGSFWDLSHLLVTSFCQPLSGPTLCPHTEHPQSVIPLVPTEALGPIFLLHS